jgi:two-component system phosphate regulon sensor histidine kinase PhoR
MWEALTIVGVAGLVVFHAYRWWMWRAASRKLALLEEKVAVSERYYQDASFQSRAQLQTLFNSMVEGVMLLDEDGRVSLVNQSLERQFRLMLDVRGLTVAEALGRADVAGLVDRLRQSREVLTIEIELNSGAPRFLEVNAASVLDRNGQPQGATLVFHDLTRIRQFENTRREFVANVSHELRTPLSLIKGYAETLINGAKDNPEFNLRFLQKIERHSNRLTNLIEDLLTISRLESGQVNLKHDVVDLRQLASHVVEDLQARAEEKATTMLNKIPAGLAARGDLDRLQQVFVNLVDNAIKYGKSPGRITLEAKEMAGPWVQVCVSDDGPGIPAEARERIFERFYRVDKARSREKGGTGLGLSIVKHALHLHGGDVSVRSRIGEGSVFRFRIPVKAEPPAR